MTICKIQKLKIAYVLNEAIHINPYKQYHMTGKTVSIKESKS